MTEKKRTPLEEAIERLRYQATAHVCTLEPKDCAEILQLLQQQIDPHDAAMTATAIAWGNTPSDTTGRFSDGIRRNADEAIAFLAEKKATR